jgi:hypothetical protein
MLFINKFNWEVTIMKVIIACCKWMSCREHNPKKFGINIHSTQCKAKSTCEFYDPKKYQVVGMPTGGNDLKD